MGKKLTDRLIKQDRYASYITIAKKEKNRALLKPSEDTIIRTEIHGLIMAGLNECKRKEQIKKELLKNERYKKYECYLDTWIEDKMKPKKIKPDKIRFEK